MSESTQMENFSIPTGTFTFSAAAPEVLEETEYTLATVIDTSGSVNTFERGLLEAQKNAVLACQKSPKKDTLLLRLVHFNSQVTDIHGFRPVSEIDVEQEYTDIHPRGMTSLHDTIYSAVEATTTYAQKLRDQQYAVNAIVIVVTDGEDTSSRNATERIIKSSIDKALSSESLESFTSVLVGVNAATCQPSLEQLKNNVNMDAFVNLQDASASSLAKLAGVISQSISSTSQALSQGGSVQLTF